MTDGTHEKYRDSTGAYLLGALPELEERAFERHVMSCAACRDEVERLRPVVEALPRSVTPLEAPAGLKRSIMAAVAEDAAPAEDGGPAEAGAATPREGILERARRGAAPLFGRFRPTAAWASAAFLLAAGVVAGAGGSQILEGGPDVRRVAAQMDDARLAEGSGTLLVAEGGDRATLSVHGLPTLPDEQSKQIYQAWLVRGDEVIPSTVFSVDSEGAGSAALLEGVEDADAVWVTREAAGGSRAPTEAPVMEVDLG